MGVSPDLQRGEGVNDAAKATKINGHRLVYISSLLLSWSKNVSQSGEWIIFPVPWLVLGLLCFNFSGAS